MNRSKIKDNSFLYSLKLSIDILRVISERRKSQLLKILILMFTSGIADIIQIFSFIPFLYILSNDYYLIIQNKSFLKFFDLIGYTPSSTKSLLMLSAILISIISLISNILRMINLWFMLRVSDLIGNDLSLNAFNNILDKDYQFHINKNSSENVTALTAYSNQTIIFIHHNLKLISGFISLLILLSGLFIYQFNITFISFIIFSLLYLIFIKYAKIKLSENSKDIAENNVLLLKNSRESFGNIREVILNRIKNFYLKNHYEIRFRYSLLITQNNFLGQAPKYLLETIGFVLLAFLALIISLQKSNLNNVFPIMGVLAVSIQRILPTLQQIYGAWAVTRSCTTDVTYILKFNYKKEKIIGNKLIKNICLKELELKNIYFKYSEKQPFVLENISFNIKKGERIGILGTTGSGKSTLLDILTGLLKSNSGDLIVNGKNMNKAINKDHLSDWQSSISHVPQNIYLSDSTFAENVALKSNDQIIDLGRVISACKKAQIYDFIKSTKYGFRTQVGERGINISGGQRQRIGLARALYKESSFLIFDEATSALDETTERKFIEEIFSLKQDITMVFVAHRLKTLEYCDRIIKIEKGKIKAIGKPDQILKKDINTN